MGAVIMGRRVGDGGANRTRKDFLVVFVVYGRDRGAVVVAGRTRRGDIVVRPRRPRSFLSAGFPFRGRVAADGTVAGADETSPVFRSLGRFPYGKLFRVQRAADVDDDGRRRYGPQVRGVPHPIVGRPVVRGAETSVGITVHKTEEAREEKKTEGVVKIDAVRVLK